MDRNTLLKENIEFSGTNGVSTVNKEANFVPAFRDEATGRIEIAKFRNGLAAPMHLICGLPEEWATDHDDRGSINRVKSSIIAGFLRHGVFYTRQQAAAFPLS